MRAHSLTWYAGSVRRSDSGLRFDSDDGKQSPEEEEDVDDLLAAAVASVNAQEGGKRPGLMKGKEHVKGSKAPSSAVRYSLFITWL